VTPRHRPAHGVADEHRLVAHPHHAAVVGDQPVVAAPRFAGLVVEVVCRQLELAVVRVQQLDPDVGLLEPLGA
jgi:hypothetical protein